MFSLQWEHSHCQASVCNSVAVSVGSAEQSEGPASGRNRAADMDFAQS